MSTEPYAPYSSPLEIAAQHVGEEAVVRLAGSVDIDDTEQLRARFEEAVGPARFVIFELSQLQFLNSLALSELIGIHRAAREAGGGLVLVGPQPRVAGVLSLTRVDRLVPVAQTIEEARTTLREAGEQP